MIKVLNVPTLYSSLYSVVDFCKKNNGEKIYIIVPDKLSLFMEKFLFEQMNISASFDIKVKTLNRFAKRNIDIDKSKQISKIGSILLINKILNDNIDKFAIFSNKAYSFTYAENIFRTISQLKASKITVDEMLDFKSQDGQLSKKIADLAIVYSEYEKCKAGLLDASDVYLMSAFNVSEGLANAKILIVGFDDFTAIEYSIIERLAISCDVNVFNYYSAEKNNYIYNKEVFEQLKNIAYINELPFEKVEVNLNRKDLKEFLDKNIYAVSNNKFCLQGADVRLYTGKTVLDEIEFVARDIREQILLGAKYKNFGIAVFGLENYENQIAEIFSKYEINYYIDSELSINKSVFYKFLNSVLRYNLDGYSLSHLIDIINSPFFNVNSEDKLNLVDQLISVGFAGKVKEDFSLLDENLQVQDAFIKFMSNLYFDKNATSEQIINKITTLCDILNVDAVINEIINDSKDVQIKILLSKTKQVLFEFFDELQKFNPDVDLQAFYEIYTHIPAVLKLNNLPLHLDCVKLVDANNNMEIFENLYIVNCTQENAPNFKFDCGIILDTEIEKLNFSHKLSPTISHINRLSRLRLYNLFTMFEKNLIITYSRNASEIIKELTTKLRFESEGEEFGLIPINISNLPQNKSLSKWDYISKIYKNGQNFIEFNEKIIKNKDFTKVSDKNLSIFKDLKTVSPSLLENYFKCPFYMFLFNILKIKPRLENDILSFDIGNVLHEIMFKYYKNKKQVGDIYEFCKREVFDFVDKDDRLKMKSNSPVLIALIDEAVRVVNGLNYLDENSSFVPVRFEQEFKGDTALNLKNVDVVGKIDRIDVSDDMARVIDYKSGKADSNLKELYYGNKLQLFLYSCAVEKQMKKKVVGSFYMPLHNKYTREIKNNYQLNGYFINEDFVIRALDKNVQPSERSDLIDMKLTKEFKARSMPESREIENLKTYSMRVSENAVDEIRSGFIKPSPLDYSNVCEYCPYSQTCLKTCKNLTTRKADSVKFASFEEVQDA